MTSRFFGERWDAPAFDEAEQVPTPVGAPCGYCERLIMQGEQGTYQIFGNEDGSAESRPVHLGCFLRILLGPPHHLLGLCSCITGRGMEDRHIFDQGDDFAEGQEVLRILRAQKAERG